MKSLKDVFPSSFQMSYGLSSENKILAEKLKEKSKEEWKRISFKKNKLSTDSSASPTWSVSTSSTTIKTTPKDPSNH